MLVRATQLGYYDLKRKRVGEEFVLKAYKIKKQDGKIVTIEPEQQFSENWMEKVDEDAPAPRGRKDQSRAPKALSQVRDEEIPTAADEDVI